MSEPIVKALRADHLTVDHHVQRALNPLRVRKMAESFDPMAIGTIIVSLRADGTYHVIDGQHRAAAMKEAGGGEESVLCLVHEGLTVPQEAALFRLHNDTKQVRPTDKFLIRVVEGEPKAVELMKILKKHGWAVTGATNRGCFSAVSSLEWVHDGGGLYEPGNGEACDVVINVLTAAFGMSPDGVRQELVRGLGLVVMRYGEDLDLRRLIVDLAAHDGGALGVVGDARSLRKLRSDNISNAMAEVLVGMANKHKRTKKIPDWRSAA